jgi:hypothetical protein
MKSRFILLGLATVCGKNGALSLPWDERFRLVRRGQRSVGTGPNLRSAKEPRESAASELELPCADELQPGGNVDVVIGNEEGARPPPIASHEVGKNGGSDHVCGTLRGLATATLRRPYDLPAHCMPARPDRDDRASDRILPQSFDAGIALCSAERGKGTDGSHYPHRQAVAQWM